MQYLYERLESAARWKNDEVAALLRGGSVNSLRNASVRAVAAAAAK